MSTRSSKTERVLLSFVFALTALFALTLLFGIPYSTPDQKPVLSGTETQISDHSWLLSALSMLPGSRTRAVAPFAVMIENHTGARPHHAGLEDALFISEYQVEGGITRFSVLFDAKRLPTSIGPVRSLRPYFLDSAAPYTSLMLFAGGSPEALEQVGSIGGLSFMNGLAYPQYFHRDPTISEPHNLFTGKQDITAILRKYSLKSISWPPFVTGTPSVSTPATEISLNFFSSDHNVTYTYGSLGGTYRRQNGDETSKAHPANILILESPIRSIGEKGRLEIDMTGQGKALLFQSGTVQEGTWKKDALVDPFVFEGENGPLLFARGQTWMTVMPSMERVKWK